MGAEKSRDGAKREAETAGEVLQFGAGDPVHSRKMRVSKVALSGVRCGFRVPKIADYVLMCNS